MLLLTFGKNNEKINIFKDVVLEVIYVVKLLHFK